MQTLDDHLIEEPAPLENVEYGHPFRRIVAGLADFVLVSLLAKSISSLGILWLTSIVGLILVCYRPAAEFMYQRTIGKSLLKLRVRSEDLQAPTLQQAIVRNVWHILPFVLVIGVLAYQYFSFGAYVPLEFENAETYVKIFGGLLVVDLATIVYDAKRRSLHDRLAKTVVVLDK